MEIRAATAAEAPGISELFASAGIVADGQALADRLAAMRQAPGATLVALQWGPPSGLVMLHWYPTLTAPRPVAQITLLLVNPEERRRGIGRLLLKAASQAARVAGCGEMEMLAPGVSTGDDPSLGEFCRATGFAEAGPRYVRSLRKQG